LGRPHGSGQAVVEVKATTMRLVQVVAVESDASSQAVVDAIQSLGLVVVE
jgi:hypothetical protein